MSASRASSAEPWQAPSWVSLLPMWMLAALALVGWMCAGYLWQGRQASSEQLRQSTAAIALGVAAAGNRALAMGLPVERLVQVEPWLRDKQQALPMVRGMAISSATGTTLFSHGQKPTAEVLKAALSAPNQLSSLQRPGEIWVSVPLRAGATEPVQGYLTVKSEVLSPPLYLAWTLALASLACLTAAAWAWRRYVLKRVYEPISQTHAVADGLSNQASCSQGFGQWPAMPSRQPRWHAASRVATPWYSAIRSLQQRHAQLLVKAQDVRASHFDPKVIARIDQISLSVSLNSSATRASESRRSFWARLSLRNSLIAASSLTLLLMLIGVWGLWSAQQSVNGRAIAQQQEQALKIRWQFFIAQRSAALSAQAQALRQSSELEAWVARHPPPADFNSPVSSPRDQSTSPAALTLISTNGEAVASSAWSTRHWLSSRAWQRLAQTREATGIWLGEDRQLYAGWVSRVSRADGAAAWLLGGEPLDIVVSAFAAEVGHSVALADLRGQAIGNDPQNWVDIWRDHGESSQRLRAAQALSSRASESPNGRRADVMSAWPLLGLDGRKMGTAIAILPPSDAVSASEARFPWLLAGLLVVLMGLALIYVGQVVNLWAHAVKRVQAMAGPTDHLAGGSSTDLDILESATRQVGDELVALHSLKRSRERQGKRQARFMRHQMMALAGRLDEAARQGVLQDLARIEAASKDLAPPSAPEMVVSSVVDEVSVLALGFQNLVGRVGDQYEQLEKLVTELRAALHAKTQLIAIQQELEIASKMQLSMLPTAAPNVAGVEVCALMHAAKEVGGDFYDYFRLDEHRIALAVGDVSGKGVPAAFFMAVSRTLLRALAQIHPSPSDCLARLNNLLEADNQEMMFVTLFYAIFDTQTGQFTYANGGHNPPYVVRANGSIEPIESLGNMALAVMSDAPYAESVVSLSPGDGVFAFSDGVTEATSPSQELFGEERLEALLRHHARNTIERRNEEVLDALRSFEGPGNQADDITMIAMHFHGDRCTPSLS